MTPTTGFSPAEGRTEPLAPLIGLGGKLRAGKDAVGDYLEESHGYTKLGMSDALNEALLALNPIIYVELENRELPEGGYLPGLAITGSVTYIHYRDLHDAVGYVEAKKNPEVRRLLQMLGTEVGRNMIDPDVWVNIAVRKITELREAGVPVVITAVRFPNEVEMIRRLGGTTIWIERPTEARTDAQGDILTHASETSVDAGMFDLTIENVGTLEDLYGWTDAVLEGIETTKAEAIASFKNRLGGHELPQTFGSNVVGNRIIL